MCHEQLGSVSAPICRPYGLLKLVKKKKMIILLPWCCAACKAPSWVETSGRQTGTTAKVNGHEAGVCGRFEKEHGKTLAQMATTGFSVSRNKPRSDAHSYEGGMCVRWCGVFWAAWFVFVTLKWPCVGRRTRFLIWLVVRRNPVSKMTLWIALKNRTWMPWVLHKH